MDEVETFLQTRNQILNEHKDNLTHVPESIKKYRDIKRSEVQFVPGDVVLLKLQHYRFKNLAKRAK